MGSNTKLHILLVEDNSGDARLVQEILKETDCKIAVTHATSLSSISQQNHYDLVLLDLNLPDSFGLNTVLEVQKRVPNIPVIVLTGLNNEELSLLSIQAGAQDYLLKDEVDAKQLLKTMQFAIKRFSATKIINTLGESKAYFATHDVISGLANQQLFLEQLQLFIERHQTIKKPFTLIQIEFYEIDKIINNFGHVAKDQIIKTIADHLASVVKPDDFLARYNENVFAILVPSYKDSEFIDNYIVDLQNVLKNPISINNEAYFLSFHVSLAVYPFDGDNPGDLIKNGYKALKDAHGHAIGKYSNMIEKSFSKKSDKLLWHMDLEFALKRDEFFLEFQPQVNLAEKKMTGVEALLRWQHPKYGMMYPTQFIPIAEESQLIIEIGQWVLEASALQYQHWQNQVQLVNPLVMSINVSPLQLEHCNFITMLYNTFKKYNLLSDQIEIELTESVFIKNPESVIQTLDAIKKFSVKIALDDFGKGYSSLSYLNHLPIDRLKLDADFVKSNRRNTPAYAVTRSIIDLAHSLNFSVIAEGVETIEQINVLEEQLCDDVQGFYYGKPTTADKIVEIFLKQMSYE